MNITPATNVQVAAIAGFIAVLVEHICKANAIIIPDDVSTAMPGAIAVLVAHIWDVCTGDNKPKA